MQFNTLILTALAASLAQAVTLKVNSDNGEVNGKFISSTHEGAGINYALLGSGGQDFSYDEAEGTLTYAAGKFPYHFDFSGKILLVGVTGTASKWSFDNSGNLLQNGEQKTYYACQNINDPYHYTDNNGQYAILSEKVNDTCKELKISRGDSASLSAADSETPTTTVAPTTVAPNTGVDWKTISYPTEYPDVDWNTVSYPTEYPDVDWTTVDYPA